MKSIFKTILVAFMGVAFAADYAGAVQATAPISADNGVITCTTCTTASSPTNYGVAIGGSSQALGFVGPDSSSTKFLRSNGSSSNPSFEAITAGNITGTMSLASGGTGTSLSDPNADRILFWDDGEGAVAFLADGSGISISTTTLNIDLLSSQLNTGSTTSSYSGLEFAGGSSQLSLLQGCGDGEILKWEEDDDTWKCASDNNSGGGGGGGGSLSEEEVEDYVGGMLGGTETGITVTYQDITNDIDFVVSDLTVAGDSGSTAMTPGDTLTVAGSGTVSTAMSGDTLTITGSAHTTNTNLSVEAVEDIVGGMLDGTETGVAVSYDDDGGANIDFVVADLTVAGDSGSTAMTPGDTLTVAGSGSVSTAMSGDTLTITGTDNNTTYSAGDGLDLSTTTFSTDLKSGSGLVITSTELDIDTDVIQARVSGTCSAGNSIRVIAANGTVTCEADTDTNTNQLTTFTLTGDSGSNQTIEQGSTFDIAGGTNATTVVGATDTVTINVDDAFVVNSGDDTMAGTLTAKGVTLSDGATGPGLVKILEDTDLGSNFTSITVGNMASDAAYTLPTALPSGNRILQSTDAGVLSWVSDTDTNTQLTEEEVEDFVGGMLGGTETGITVAYNDTDNDIDFAVADLTVAGDSGSTAMTPGDTLTLAGGTNISTSMSGDTLTITGSAHTTDTNLTEEEVEDFVGTMVAGGTETNIAVTYTDGGDGAGVLNFVVADAFLKNDAADVLDVETSATNTVTDVLTLQSQSSGTPANNIGVGVALGIETAAGNVETGARIAAVATDVDPTNEDVDLVFYTMLSGDTANEALRVHDDGTVTAATFVGALTGNVTGNVSGSSGSTTGNAATATLAATVTIADNEDENESNAIIFTPGGDLDGGNFALESDGTFNYNPSSGTVTATTFVGAFTGNVSGSSGSTTGNAGTASALAANPTDCSSNQFANAIAADGDLTCAAISDADVPNTITVDLATAATALASNPTDCGSNQFATTIAASGNLTCAAISDADVPNTITASNYLPLAGGTLTGALAVQVDTDTELVAATLTNLNDEGSDDIVSVLFNLEDSGGTLVDSGKVAVKKTTTMTGTASTQDTSMVFSTSVDGTLTERMTIASDGTINATTFVGALTGEAQTAAALAANPTDCSANEFANAIAADGDLTCAAIADADVPNTITVNLAAAATALQTARNIGGVSFDGTGNINLPGVNTAGNQNTSGNADTASALAANPTDCSANEFANAIAADGDLTCAAIADGDVPDTITASNYLPLAGGTLTANIEIDVASGDPAIVFDTDGADKFTVGVDDSESDKFKIDSGGSLEDAGDFELDSSGNLAIAGDLTIGGDDLVMNTNTDAYVLVADGTNFNPVAMSGDVAIANDGATAIQANSVALSTDTTGNYVATITAGTGLTSTGGTSGEGVAHSLSVDAAQSGITSVGTLTGLTVSNDVTIRDAVNDGNPVLALGAAAAEQLTVTSAYDSGGQTLDYVEFATATADTGADEGRIIFDIDGTDIATIDDGGIELASGKTFTGALTAGTTPTAEGLIEWNTSDNRILVGDGSSTQTFYAGAHTTNTNTMGNGFVLEDHSGDEVTITESKEVKFIAGTGVTIDWTDVTTGDDSDPYDLTFSVDTSSLLALSGGTMTGNIEFDLASGDPAIVFDTQGADKFTVGVDDSDSDLFKINSGGTLADDSDFEMDSSGNVTTNGGVSTGCTAGSGDCGVTLTDNTANPSDPGTDKTMLHTKAGSLYVYHDGDTTPGSKVVVESAIEHVMHMYEDNLGTAADFYTAPIGFGVGSTTAGNERIPAFETITITKIACAISSSFASSGAGRTVYFEDNGTDDSGCKIEFLGGNTTGSDTCNTVVTAGHTMTLHWDETGAAAGRGATCAVYYKIGG